MRTTLSKLAAGLIVLACAGVLVAAAVAGSSTARARVGRLPHRARPARSLEPVHRGHPRRRRRRRGRRAAPRSSSRARTTPPARRTRCSPTSARRSTRSSSTRSTAHAIVTAVKAANKAGIPVIAVQSNVNGGKTATFIAGREDHRRPRDGRRTRSTSARARTRARSGSSRASAPTSRAPRRTRRSCATIGQHKNIKIVGQGETQYDPAKALNVATNLLTAHPGIDYLYAWWDPGGAAAVKAIQAEGQARQDRRRLAERRLHRARPRAQGPPDA